MLLFKKITKAISAAKVAGMDMDESNKILIYKMLINASFSMSSHGTRHKNNNTNKKDNDPRIHSHHIFPHLQIVNRPFRPQSISSVNLIASTTLSAESKFY